MIKYIDEHSLNKDIYMSNDITLKSLINRIIYHYNNNTNPDAILFEIVKDLIHNKIK